MAAPTPQEIEDVLEQMREVLIRWHRGGVVGEVTVVSGRNQYQLEECPRHKHRPVSRGGTKSENPAIGRETIR